MSSWVHGSSFNEADEDNEASAEVASEIEAVDKELRQLHFEMQLEKANSTNIEKSSTNIEKSSTNIEKSRSVSLAFFVSFKKFWSM